MALTKAEMAEHLFDQLGLNKCEAKDIVEMFFEIGYLEEIVFPRPADQQNRLTLVLPVVGIRPPGTNAFGHPLLAITH